MGMRLKFEVGANGSVARGEFNLAHRYMGRTSSAHRGIVATVLSEAMEHLERAGGGASESGEMQVEFLRPVPLGRKIVVEARRLASGAQKHWRECVIRDAKGNLLAHARGRFATVVVGSAARKK